MADFTNAKTGPSVYPSHATEADYQRLEPIIGPSELVNRFLFGIPLVSQIKDPFTGKAQVLTKEIVQDLIDSAIQTAETELNIDIRPVVRSEKYPFDRQGYEAFGYFQLNHRPVTKLMNIAVTPSNGVDVYTVPLDWVETALLPLGQINIIPMTAAFIQGGYIPSGTTGGNFFLAVLGNKSWIPAYWRIDYTSGFCDGLVPRVVNDLIGIIAAMDILSMLATTYARVSSSSLSIDGMSQSVSTPGPQVFQARLDELKEKRKLLVNKIKHMYGRKFFTSWT